MVKKKDSKKVKEQYFCEICNYKCQHKGNYNKHLLSKRHANLCITSNFAGEIGEIFRCICGKTYKHRQSLYNHERRCKVREYPSANEKIVLDDEKPSYEQLLNIITNLIPKVGNNNNNVINNNINIQLFLDEKCKDAMTIQNFANRLTLSIEDLLKERKMLGNVGNIVVENLKPIRLLERPFLCTDCLLFTSVAADE